MKRLILLALLLPACTRDSWPAQDSHRCAASAWPCPTIINGESYMICRPKEEQCGAFPQVITGPAAASAP